MSPLLLQLLKILLVLLLLKRLLMLLVLLLLNVLVMLLLGLREHLHPCIPAALAVKA